MAQEKKYSLEAVFNNYKKHPVLTAFALQLAVWTFIGVIGTAQNYYIYHFAQKKDFSFSTILFFNLPIWWFWLAATPFIIKVTEFLRSKAKHLSFSILIHLLFCSVIIAVHQLLIAMWCNHSFGKALYMPLLDKFIYRTVKLEWPFIDLMVYGVIVGIYLALDYYRKLNEKEIKYSQLETKFAQAKLVALKMQIHPHFLFNTLNGISTLIVTGENEKANKMLTLFGDFLRQTLDGEECNEIELEKEIDFINKYIAVQKIRFGERMQVFFDILPETNSLIVPNFILQPVVENSVRYAIANKKEEGLIIIRSRLHNNKLVLEVEDNGTGINENEETQLGIGLKNTKARLMNMYKDEAILSMKNLGNGFLVSIEIPAVPFSEKEKIAEPESANHE